MRATAMHYRTPEEARAHGIDWDTGTLLPPDRSAPPSVPSGRAPARRDGMTLTESRYADVLESRRLAGEILRWEFEAEPLILSDAEGRRCEYTPDFKLTFPDDSIEYHEVKGAHVFEDSRIKLKWAAEKYAPTPFFMCRWKGGKWTVKRFGPGAKAKPKRRNKGS